MVNKRIRNPKTEAVAFRIWRVCSECDWDMTPGEIATAIGESPQVVGAVLQAKGWDRRVRAGSSQIIRASRVHSMSLDTIARDYAPIIRKFSRIASREEDE